MDVEVGPVINCTSYFTYVGNDLTVTYSGYMLYGQPADYFWNFGDGQTATGQSATHTYGAAGIYYVSLSTVDSTGCQYSSGQSVMVGDSGQFYQVYGQVFAGTFPETMGIVMILGIDTTLNYFPFIDIAYLDSNGVYYFPMVPTGSYYIYAIPFDSGGYLPTYYGDVLFWTEATVVTLPQPDNPYDIHLQQGGLLLPGPGNINGQINTGDFVAGMVDKITMELMDASSTMIGFSQVDAGGAFQFPQLAYGTYYLHAEMAGCTSDLIVVEITEQNPDVNVVLTFAGGHILGVNDHTLTLDAGVVYPNPVREEANINVNTAKQTVLTAEVIDLTGRSVRKVTEAVSAGNHRITIPVSGLPTGMYTLRIYSGEGLSAAKKMVISR
jgi:PKD repeat protein